MNYGTSDGNTNLVGFAIRSTIFLIILWVSDLTQGWAKNGHHRFLLYKVDLSLSKGKIGHLQEFKKKRNEFHHCTEQYWYQCGCDGTISAEKKRVFTLIHRLNFERLNFERPNFE
jgi:hypothetical protein